MVQWPGKADIARILVSPEMARQRVVLREENEYVILQVGLLFCKMFVCGSALVSMKLAVSYTLARVRSSDSN